MLVKSCVGPCDASRLLSGGREASLEFGIKAEDGSNKSISGKMQHCATNE